MSIFGENPLAGLDESGTVATDTGQTTPDVAETPVSEIPTSGSTEVTEPVEGAAPAAADPEPVYFNADDYKDHLVKLKVGGQDVELPLSEALAGAMRAQDYTRKTQELAEERRRLFQAEALAASLENDAERTIRQLAEVYDLDVSGLQPVQREPEEQRLIEARRELAAREAAINRQRIQNEIQALTQEFGDFDVPAVAQFAYQTGTDLTTAYKAMNYDLQRQQQQEAARQEAARQAARNAQVAHSGATTQRGSIGEAPIQVNSIQDAFRLAQQQLNMT